MLSRFLSLMPSLRWWYLFRLRWCHLFIALLIRIFDSALPGFRRFDTPDAAALMLDGHYWYFLIFLMLYIIDDAIDAFIAITLWDYQFILMMPTLSCHDCHTLLSPLFAFVDTRSGLRHISLSLCRCWYLLLIRLLPPELSFSCWWLIRWFFITPPLYYCHYYLLLFDYWGWWCPWLMLMIIIIYADADYWWLFWWWSDWLLFSLMLSIFMLMSISSSSSFHIRHIRLRYCWAAQ